MLMLVVVSAVAIPFIDSHEGNIADASTSDSATDVSDYNGLTSALTEATGGETIVLIADITVPDNTAIQIKDKNNTEKPITIDFNGYVISGNNANTSTSYSASNDTASGLLWIGGSDVILTDNSTPSQDGTKGGLKNTVVSTKSVNTLFVCASGDYPASVRIDGGVNIAMMSTTTSGTDEYNTMAKAMNIFGYSSKKNIDITLNDATITSVGYVIFFSDRDYISITIDGGQYRSLVKLTKSNYPISPDDCININGGSFLNCDILDDHSEHVRGKAVIVDSVDGNTMEIVQDSEPTSYSACMQIPDRLAGIVYLSDDITDMSPYLHLLGDQSIVTLNSGITINGEYGETQGEPIHLTLILNDGASVTGNLKICVAEVELKGTSIPESFITPYDENYAVGFETSTNTYIGELTEAATSVELSNDEGTLMFTSMATALTHASNHDNSTIKLIKDVQSKKTTVSNTVNIDLNGHTWTLTESILVKTSGVFNIQNGSETGGTILLPTDTKYIFGISGGSVSIGNGVTVKGNTILLEGDENGRLSVSGTIDTTGTKNTPIMGNGSDGNGNTQIDIYEGAVILSDVAAIYHPQSGTLTVHGGTITGSDGIYIKSGTLIVQDGTIKANGPYYEYQHNPNGYTTNGNAITIEACDYPGGAPSASINGGSIISANNQALAYYLYEGSSDIDNKFFITGGEFSSDVSEYVDYNSGSHLIGPSEEDGLWTVERWVANADGYWYDSLQNAIECSSNKVTLFCDTDENVTVEKELTIDLRECDITGSITVGADISIIGSGTVSCVSICPGFSVTINDEPTIMDVKSDADGYKITTISGEKGTSYLSEPMAYVVKFDSNGGTGTIEDLEAKNGAPAFIPDDTPSRTGYIFDSWNTVVDGSGTTYTTNGGIDYIPAEDGETITLYAQWNPIIYRVLFDSNDGEGEIQSLTVRYDESVDLPENTLTRNGYTFDGWNTKADGSGTSYSDKATISNLTSVDDDDVTLYAQWEPIVYYIVFDPNGGEGIMAEMTVTFGVKTNLTENTFTRSGYTFDGWNTKADGSGMKFVDGDYISDLSYVDGERIQLYAQWVENNIPPSGDDDPVASIGDKEFATLQEAFEYAQDGDTIELQDHIIQKDGILLDKKEHSITLDLNGKTLNVEEGASINNRVIKIESGSLTVIDSSSDKTGKIIASGSGTTSSNGTGAYGAFRVEADGILIANDITLENSRPWGMNVKVCGGEAYLTGVTITSSYGGGIEVTEADLGTHSKAGIAVLVDCDFIQKGYFDHCSSAVSVSGGSSVTVKGGSYISEGRAIYVFSSGGYITVEDGYFSGDMEAIRAEIDTGTYPEYVGGVIIEGGEFDGKFSITSPATLAISGGTFDNNPSDYVSDGFHAFESTYGTDTIWTVEKIAATSGDKIYPTVQDAIDDAGTGTITLADDSAENLTVTETAIISANGHDITGTVTVSGTLTLTGTGSVSSVILSSTTAKLVVEGPTVTSVTDSVSNYHVVSSTVDGVTTYSLARTSSGGGGTVTPPVNPPVTPDEPETDVEEHPDGSTTETTTETTTNPDGSKTESTTVTEKDPEGNVTGSTVTETTTSEKEEDGVKETVTSTTVTTNDSEGNRTGSTSTSTTTTVTDSTTTVTEKEEVKDADDRVTSSTEKVTETTRIDGGTVTSETTEVKDAAGNVTSSTESVKAESDDGNVRTEAVTESGTTTVNTTVSVSASGQVDDALIQQAVAQSDAVSEKVSAESPDRVIQIGTGSDTDITLSPESMSAIADTGAEFRVISETGSMQLDRDVVGTLTEPGEDVTVRMAESDDSDLTEAQQSAKGDRFGVTLTATVGTDRYHILGGTVTVTIPYAESMGADPGSLGVFYIDEDGIRTFMESVYDQVLKSFVFQTDHFSLFIVDDLPAPAGDGGDTMLYAGIAAVIVVVIVAAAVLYKKH